MKKFTFKGVLDGFRSSVQAAPRVEQEIQETLRSEHFQIKKTFRHGFPFSPTALAWDPIQKLLAIGDKAGNIRILGGAGVDAHARHDSGEAVLHAVFMVNEGQLITATADDQLHLWNFSKQKKPVRKQSLKFQRERITCLHLPLQSKWLHVGTERGNVHVVHIESFMLSGYVINWNKAIEVTRANHPGAVVDLSDNPLDASKLLIAFESGLLVIWDMRSRTAEWRGVLSGSPTDGVRAAAWQHDGKFMTAHVDGALATWSTRANRPMSVSYPHAKPTKDGKLETCKPIQKLEWKTSKTGESFVIFSGGLPSSYGGRSHSVTVLTGRSTTVLEMEHPVVDFVTLCESPYSADYQEPYAIAVLLSSDLVVVDLLSPGFPTFETPHPLDLHDAPVTCLAYFADCPSDLIPAFYSVGRSSSRAGAGPGAGAGAAGAGGAGAAGGGGAARSPRLWPVSGGEWAPACCSYSEIILTGHADGTVKFWDASAGTLQILYKLKGSKVFERRPAGGEGGEGGEGSLAVCALALCAESRRLAVAAPHGHVVLYKFRKAEAMAETPVLEIPQISDTLEEEPSPEELSDAASGVWTGGGGGGGAAAWRVRGAVGTGAVRKPPGFQAALVALQQGVAHPITTLTINSSYGLMAWGGERGVVVVDVWRRCVVFAAAAAALYAAPPAPPPAAAAAAVPRDRQRSPSLDQLEEASRHSPLPPVTPAEPADAVDKNENRRKSTPWKMANLKRQLSKVDLKLKAAFTVPSENNDNSEEKPTAQFYTDTTDAVETVEEENIAESTNASPENDERAEKDEETEGDNSDTTSPLRVCSDVFERMHKELQERRAEPYDRMHKELQQRWADRDSSPPASVASRPQHLPLSEEDVAPARPPRQKDKRKKDDDDKRDIRDQRLLSVPNIKYRPADVTDLRRKQSGSGPQPPGLANSLMRRFRMFVAGLCNRCGREHSGPNEPEATTKRIEPPIPQSLASMEYLHIMQPNDKLDSSFSRSRSSSISSLENISQEGIQCLAFADSYTKKSDPTALLPTLWIGTTLGSVITMMINLPEADLRHTQPVSVSTSGGPIFRLKGSILAMSFLDCNGALIPYSYESWRDDSSKDSRDRRDRTPTKQGSSSRMSPTPATEGGGGAGAGAGGAGGAGDRQFVVIASEKQARVVALPSQNCVYRQQIVDQDFVVKAEIVSLKDSVCLVNYLSTGHLAAYSLPSLRPLVHVDFLPLSELRIAKTFCFSNRGHGLYLASPSEIQKFTIDAEFCGQMQEMLGAAFVSREMPEPPREGFFRGLFGGGARTLDRDELFGESGSGKPNRAVAKHIPCGGAAVAELNTRATTAAGEVSRAHMLMLERGDKLSQLEDKAERMHNQAGEFSSSAHQLMLKYKDKKWYQL